MLKRDSWGACDRVTTKSAKLLYCFLLPHGANTQSIGSIVASTWRFEISLLFEISFFWFALIILSASFSLMIELIWPKTSSVSFIRQSAFYTVSVNFVRLKAFSNWAIIAGDILLKRILMSSYDSTKSLIAFSLHSMAISISVSRKRACVKYKLFFEIDLKPRRGFNFSSD